MCTPCFLDIFCKHSQKDYFEKKCFLIAKINKPRVNSCLSVLFFFSSFLAIFLFREVIQKDGLIEFQAKANSINLGLLPSMCLISGMQEDEGNKFLGQLVSNFSICQNHQEGFP